MMTWEELVEKSKVLGYKKAAVQLDLDDKPLEVVDCLYKEVVWFHRNGLISVTDDYENDVDVAVDRTFEQMWQIMEALK